MISLTAALKAPFNNSNSLRACAVLLRKADMQLKDTQLFRQQAFIDGAWVDADNGQTIKVNNPATGEILGTVPKMGAAETRRAIEAADKALPAWRALTAKDRANKLRRWFELIIENQDDLARLMTLEQGKPLAEAKGEIVYAASFIEWFAEEAKRVYGDVIPGHQPDKRLIVIKQPIGVTAAITPWNFPAAMITRKAGPALAAGCTMVLKPASQTPFSAFALAELAQRAGIPKGVFSVVSGSAGDIGSELTSNPIVRKLSFTGSTEIGRQLMAECAKDIKKVSLELGGNAPFIVLCLVFRLPKVTTRLIPRSVRHWRASNLARRQFLEQNLHHTLGSTGVLIFVSEAERYVEILVDDGISKHLDDSSWDSIVTAFTQQVKQGQTLVGFIACIEASSKVYMVR